MGFYGGFGGSLAGYPLLQHVHTNPACLLCVYSERCGPTTFMYLLFSPPDGIFFLPHRSTATQVACNFVTVVIP